MCTSDLSTCPLGSGPRSVLEEIWRFCGACCEILGSGPPSQLSTEESDPQGAQCLPDFTSHESRSALPFSPHVQPPSGRRAAVLRDSRENRDRSFLLSCPNPHARAETPAWAGMAGTVSTESGGAMPGLWGSWLQVLRLYPKRSHLGLLHITGVQCLADALHCKLTGMTGNVWRARGRMEAGALRGAWQGMFALGSPTQFSHTALTAAGDCPRDWILVTCCVWALPGFSWGEIRQQWHQRDWLSNLLSSTGGQLAEIRSRWLWVRQDSPLKSSL